MYRVEQGAPTYPSISVHWIGPDCEPHTEMRHTTNPAIAMCVVVGDGGSPAHLELAARLAGACDDDTLVLAVMACASDHEERLAAEALSVHADSVLAAAPDGLAATVDALLDAVLRPVSPEHPWCFDWNDMRALCSGGAGVLARLAISRAVGPDAAADAVDICLRLNRADPARPVRMLLMVTLAGQEQMALHHAALRRLQASASGSLIGTGLTFDPALAADDAIVTLVGFGPHVPLAHAPQAWSGAQDNLPAFLRQPQAAHAVGD